MTNPSLQEIDEQLDKECICLYDPDHPEEWDNLKSFIHKVIAERDEALRQSFREIDRYYTNPKGKVMVYVDDVSSLLSKE